MVYPFFSPRSTYTTKGVTIFTSRWCLRQEPQRALGQPTCGPHFSWRDCARDPCHSPVGRRGGRRGGLRDGRLDGHLDDNPDGHLDGHRAYRHRDRLGDGRRSGGGRRDEACHRVVDHRIPGDRRTEGACHHSRHHDGRRSVDDRRNDDVQSREEVVDGSQKIQGLHPADVS